MPLGYWQFCWRLENITYNLSGSQLLALMRSEWQTRCELRQDRRMNSRHKYATIVCFCLLSLTCVCEMLDGWGSLGFSATNPKTAVRRSSSLRSTSHCAVQCSFSFSFSSFYFYIWTPIRVHRIAYKMVTVYIASFGGIYLICTSSQRVHFFIHTNLWWAVWISQQRRVRADLGSSLSVANGAQLSFSFFFSGRTGSHPWSDGCLGILRWWKGKLCE